MLIISEHSKIWNSLQFICCISCVVPCLVIAYAEDRNIWTINPQGAEWQQIAWHPLTPCHPQPPRRLYDITQIILRNIPIALIVLRMIKQYSSEVTICDYFSQRRFPYYWRVCFLTAIMFYDWYAFTFHYPLFMKLYIYFGWGGTSRCDGSIM